MHGFIIIVVFAILIIIAYGSPAENGEGPTATKSLAETVEELQASNQYLSEKIFQLENRISETSSAQQYIWDEINYFHPTVQFDNIEFNVYNWTNEVKSELRHHHYQFHTGQAIGALSTWALQLAFDKETQSVGMTLILQVETHNSFFFFAGFTVSVIDADDNIYTNMSLMPTNFIQIKDHSVHLGNVISLAAIDNPANKILKNDTLRLKIRIELLGSGHKLYQQAKVTPLPGRDVQIVVFYIRDFVDKLNTNTVVDGTSPSIAHTTFQLVHPWGMITNWTAEIKEERDKTISLLVEVSNMDSEWTQLFASYRVEIFDNQRKMISKHQAPYHDYKKESMLMENIINVSDFTQNVQNVGDDTLEFKLFFVVFNKNARFYLDVY